MIKYWDRTVGAPSELWLFHRHDGNVQGIGEQVVRAVHAFGLYVEDGSGLERLWQQFPPEFENATGLEYDIEFLYRISYTGGSATIRARHGGFVGERAPQHYRSQNDTPSDSVELYTALFAGGAVLHRGSFGYDIREPESYVRTLREADQPAARTWRGRLR